MKAYAFQLVEQAPENRAGTFCYCLMRCLATETYRARTVNLSDTMMYDFLTSIFADEKANTLVTSENLRTVVEYANETPGRHLLTELRMVESTEEDGSEEAVSSDQDQESATRRGEELPRTSTKPPNNPRSKKGNDAELRQTQTPARSSSDSSNSTQTFKAETNQRAASRPAASTTPGSLPEGVYSAYDPSLNPHTSLIINSFQDLPQDPTLCSMPDPPTGPVPTFPWLIYNVLRRRGPALTLSDIVDYIVAWCPGRLKQPKPGDTRTAEETLNGNLRHNLTINGYFVGVPKDEMGTRFGGWRIRRSGEEVARKVKKQAKKAKKGKQVKEEKQKKQLESPPTTLDRSPSSTLSSLASSESQVAPTMEACNSRKRKTAAGYTVADNEDELEDEAEDEDDEPVPKRQRCSGN